MICKRLSNKYVLEISGFRKWETPYLFDGDFHLSYDSKKNDHAPGIYFFIAAFGWMLIDFTLHNRHHRSEPELIKTDEDRVTRLTLEQKIYDLIDDWHKIELHNTRDLPLNEYLGMTENQYARWVENKRMFTIKELKHIVTCSYSCLE